MSETLTAEQKVIRPPLLNGGHGFKWVSENVSGIIQGKTPIWWWILFFICAPIGGAGMSLLVYQVSTGVGVWGENQPVGWGWDITCFVFWVGIAHAGTLISALLLLTRQKWRTGIGRAAEATTVFALMCGAVYPAVHIGRVWFAWYLAPIPNQYGMWPNFRSALLWDVFAVNAYLSVSAMFWLMGMIPDFATLKTRTSSPWMRRVYHILSCGWTGSAKNWRHYEMAALCLSGLSVALVFAVSSTVSFDFSTSVIPGWHTTIFPPYFVIGAIFAGMCMVLTIFIPLRAAYPQLKDIITLAHVDRMAKLLLMAALLVDYVYTSEFFMAYYGGNPYERHLFLSRYFPEYGPLWFYGRFMLFCNLFLPQLLWIRPIRKNLLLLFIICQFGTVGMWFERFVIIVPPITEDFLPSSWHIYHPTWVEVGTFAGTLGLFFTLVLLFIRFIPIVSIAELKGALPQADPHGEHKTQLTIP